MTAYLSLGLSIIMNALSLILMKYYALRLDSYKAEISLKKKLLDYRLIISVVSYGISAILWLIALSGVDLMVAYPTLSLTYVLIGIVSPKLFTEYLSPRRWGGILVIITGVIVMNL